MSLLLGCISWLSLSQHTSSCLYSTGDMQSYEDWILHKKHKAISLQHCKCLSELTSWCVDCVFYRGNNISIFLVSHWKVTEWVSLQNSIIAKPLRGMCALWPYIKKREKRKRRVIFLIDLQRQVVLCQMHRNMLILLSFQLVVTFWPLGKFLPSFHLLLEQLGRVIWLWLAAHMFIRHYAPFFWNNSKHHSVRLLFPPHKQEIEAA